MQIKNRPANGDQTAVFVLESFDSIASMLVAGYSVVELHHLLLAHPSSALASMTDFVHRSVIECVE